MMHKAAERANSKWLRYFVTSKPTPNNTPLNPLHTANNWRPSSQTDELWGPFHFTLHRGLPDYPMVTWLSAKSLRLVSFGFLVN